jgi:hypothetical protein
MPGHQYTPPEYALQLVIKSFGNLLSELAECSLSRTYAVVLCFCQLKIIDGLELRYLHTGALLFEEYSLDMLFDLEV